jgi:ketopantoate reductase
VRFLIVGAGALGGYYGGMLLKGGADVTFLVRPARAAQLAERGLVIKRADDEFRTPVKTVTARANEGPYDVVFVTCKAYDLDAAIDDFAPVTSPAGAVLPVLNGINHIARLTDRLGASRVLGGVTFFSVVRTPEGDVMVPGHGSGRNLVWGIDQGALFPVRGDPRRFRRWWGSKHGQRPRCHRDVGEILGLCRSSGDRRADPRTGRRGRCGTSWSRFCRRGSR